MPVFNRFTLLLLASLLAVGCAGDDATTAKPEKDAAAAPPAEATTEGTEAASSEASAVTPPTPKDDSEADVAPATMAYADANLSARGQDEALQVCWAEASSDKKASYALSGTIQLAPGRRPELDQIVLVASDAPINKWKNGGKIPIYSVGMAMLGDFKLAVEAGPEAVYVCAFAPPTFDDNQTFMVAGCTDEPIAGKAGESTAAKGIELVVTERTNPLATIGGARFGKEAWTGDRVRRTVQGTVKGKKAQAFVIATAPTPILEEESASEPLGMGVAGPDGVFSVSYFATPREPLYVCAMAFDDAKAPSSLAGMGCVNVALPESKGSNDFKGVTVTVGGEAEEMDGDDKSHIALLQRCLATKK